MNFRSRINGRRGHEVPLLSRDREIVQVRSSVALFTDVLNATSRKLVGRANLNRSNSDGVESSAIRFG